MHHFNGHFSGEPLLAVCPLDNKGHCRIEASFFTGGMLFLAPNQCNFRYEN